MVYKELFGVQDSAIRPGIDNTNYKIVYVDGTNGSDTNCDGSSWACALATVQAGVTAAGAGGFVYVMPKAMAAGATDPGDYAENIVIPATMAGLSIIGVNRGRTQGGLPQLKVGTTTTSPILTIRAPGCHIANLGINGIGGTGGGLLLDDDNSTKTAIGTTIESCHFKNCVGTTATNAATGGAIMWAATGGAWQVLIKDNRFYKNVGDIVLKGTSQTVPQDVVIENNIFSGPASAVDCNIYAAGSGFNGLVVRNCSFQQKPAIGSGTNAKYIVLPTGTVGIISACRFACQTNTTGGTRITFKSGGSGGDFPTTVHIVESYGQSITASETGEINIS